MLAACGGDSKSTGSDSSKGEASADSGEKVNLAFGIWDENQRAAMQAMVDAYVEGGILADMTEAIAASDINDSFAETLVNNYVRNGVNYAVPKDFDTNALWYNKEMFDNAGVAYPTDDMTYEDLVALATELKDKLPEGVYPFACPVDFQTWYYQTVYANGGWILNEDATETGYADPKTQEGIQCWIDMIDAGLSPSASTLAETGSDAMFEGEQIAMTLAGSYMVPEYSSNDTIKDKIDCVEVPTFNGVESNCINGLGFAVYEGSKNKEEAIKFAVWLGGADAQKIQGDTGVVISAREDAQPCFEASNSSIIWQHTPITQQSSALFGTFMLRQFFMSLPKELEEAAIMDGCGQFRVFGQIMLPLVKPGIGALVIFTVKFAWNDFMWPLIVNTTPSKMTLGPALSTLQGQYTTEYPMRMAGAVLAVAPLVVMFFIFRKQFIEGVAQSGIKE